jgi:SAM-dependent methyltransferase
MKLILEAEKSVAFDSPDHLMPHGTAQDNSKNRFFNCKLNLLYGSRRLRILDIGCSGGGFVKSCLSDGHDAVGIEGSDYSLRHKRAEWRTIPENLFTCDATAFFRFKTANGSGSTDQTAQFDVVTAWEFVEHIAKAQLPAVVANVDRHLARNGLWIMSLNTKEDVVNGVRLHQTVESRDWWLAFFESLNFINRPELVSYFGQDWVRGPLQNHGAGSFNLLLTRKCDVAPSRPRKVRSLPLNALCMTANIGYRVYWLGRGSAAKLVTFAGMRRSTFRTVQ